jgi:pyrimidine deaminase RibD-like protein
VSTILISDKEVSRYPLKKKAGQTHFEAFALHSFFLLFVGVFAFN